MIVSEWKAVNYQCCVDTNRNCTARLCMAWRDAFEVTETHSERINDPAAFKAKGWNLDPRLGWVRTEHYGFCGRAGEPADGEWVKAQDAAKAHNAL